MTRGIDDIGALLKDESAEIRRRAVLDIGALAPSDAAPLILLALGDEDWRVRKEAAAAATQLADYKPLVLRLIQATRDEDNIGLKNAAVEALSKAGEKVESETALLLQSIDPEARKAAVNIIGALKTRHAVDLLCVALHDENLNIRVSAAEQLGEQNDPSAEVPLLQCLNLPHSLLRFTALQSLRNLNISIPWSYLEPLLSDPILNEELLLALGRSGAIEAVPEIARHLVSDKVACLAMEDLHSRSETAARAVEHALESLDTASRAALSAMTKNDDADVVRAAACCILWSKNLAGIPDIVSLARNSLLYPTLIEGLVAWGAPAVDALHALVACETDQRLASVIGLLSRLLDDETGSDVAWDFTRHLSSQHPAVATAAANAVARFGDETVIESLVQLLVLDDPRIRGAAGHALAETGRRYPDAVRAASATLPLEGPAGAQICRVLEVVGVEEDLERLTLAVQSKDREIRRSALRALAIIGKARATAQVAAALSDPDLFVRIAAADALALIGPEAQDIIVDALNIAEGSLLAALLRALGKVGHPMAEEILSNMCQKSADVILCAIDTAVSLKVPLTSMQKQLLGHPDNEVVKGALNAFGRNLPVPELAGLLSHESWDLRLKAVEELETRIAEEGVKASLQDRLSLEDNDLVLSALIAAIAKGRGEEA